MKLVAEYLEHVLRFERMAVEATGPKLKENLLKQADAYRKLAKERAASLNLRPINLPAATPDKPT